MMEYTSTRDAACRVSAAQAILTGLASDGGLFVPVEIEKIDLKPLLGKSYPEVAFAVLKSFLPDYSQTFLADVLASSYAENFDHKAGHLVKLNDKLFSLELWHGPTAAFKDYALQLMPKLLVEAKQLLKETGRTLILVATSGDTGKAALEGFKDVPGTGIIVFYPNEGTSEIQKLQMATQAGENVAVYAVNGNFDDAQRGVKAAFRDKELAGKLAERNTKLSSANSINWGRLVPQIVYYVTSYLRLCEEKTIHMGEPINFCVPTGNFGDIMAGYYARKMGVPIHRFICASNANNVLTDFIKTGHYDAKRTFYKTSSPSMDILVSSNLERLLFHASQSSEQVAAWMQQLAETGGYTVDQQTLTEIQNAFDAGWASEDAVGEEIKFIYDTYSYLCDPHTAVGFRVARDQVREALEPTVVLSTASPFKFCEKVLSSLGQAVPGDEFEALRALEQYAKIKAPSSLTSLREQPIRFKETIPPDKIAEVTLRFE